jgi:hypothetical protein
MTNPTTPFSWQMPTASDLVTDLPADFETFGQAVATSMADLLGGTTGQVLSKASNTDMDFTWVAQDDSNAIQNAIVDAKGDLIAASANDTPARLAVGTNGLVLTADSTAATGLSYQRTGLNLVYSGSFSGATSHTFDSVFTTDYDNYKVIVQLTSVAGTDTNIGFGLRLSGVGSVNYSFSNIQWQFNTTNTMTADSASLVAYAANNYQNGGTGFTADVISPQNATATICTAQGNSWNSSGIPYRTTTTMYKYDTTGYFGCFVNSTSGNIGGTIKIYGYRD